MKQRNEKTISCNDTKRGQMTKGEAKKGKAKAQKE
jgi:hypothetical protein